MQFFDSLEQVESFLADLARGESPLIRVLPARPGQKESRYVQLLSGEPIMPESAPIQENDSLSTEAGLAMDTSRLEAIEKQLAELRAELRDLREELLSFRKQFE
jgi:uncharacterized protein YceH (UPF0502 family)